MRGRGRGMVGLVGGREVAGVVGSAGQDEGGLSLLLATDSGAVLSADDRDVHKPQDRLRRPLAAAWHPTNSD